MRPAKFLTSILAPGDTIASPVDS